MAQPYRQTQPNYQSSLADSPPSQRERYIEFSIRLPPEHEAEANDMMRKLISVGGFNVVMEWAQKIIDNAPATPEEMQERFVELQQHINDGLLRYQALGPTPKSVLEDFLAKVAKKGLSEKQVLYVYFQEAIDLSNRDLADIFDEAIDSVRRTIYRAWLKIDPTSQEGQ
jgi:hypothetical protein